MTTLPCRPTLKVTMACEDAAMEARALQMLTALLKASEPDSTIHLVKWRFDLLSDPESLDEAVDEADDADFLVFAMHQPHSRPSAGTTWINTCLAGRTKRAITIIAIFGEDEPWIISLEEGVAVHPMVPAQQEPFGTVAFPRHSVAA